MGPEDLSTDVNIYHKCKLKIKRKSFIFNNKDISILLLLLLSHSSTLNSTTQQQQQQQHQVP